MTSISGSPGAIEAVRRDVHDIKETTEMTQTPTIMTPNPDDASERPGTMDSASDESPFGTGSTTMRGRTMRLGIYGGVVVLALVAAYIATRRSNETGDAGGHSQGTAPVGDSAAPVMLPAAEAQRIGVTYATATMGPVGQEVRTVGQVTYDETRVSTIAPKVDGFVEELHVNFTGQSVRRGDPILSIYSPMLVTAQEELLLARRLVSDVAGGTPEAVRGAEGLLASARRRLLYWDVPESEVERMERTGEVRRTLTLVSPASGFVIEKSVLSGQRIMAGDALFKLADLSVVWVEGEVFEQDLAAVRTGQSVAVSFEAFPSEQWVGRIAYIYPTLSSETRTMRVRVELANRGLRLKPGMYATLQLTGATRGDVLSVPRSAVLSTGKRNLVFVRRPDGMLEPREVALGVVTDERIEIREGLTAGETVVASATFLIDAESNLGSALGGMRNMPGMDMSDPSTGTDRPRTIAPMNPVSPPSAAPRSSPPPAGAGAHAGHRR